jgi:hypothetical protein
VAAQAVSLWQMVLVVVQAEVQDTPQLQQQLVGLEQQIKVMRAVVLPLHLAVIMFQVAVAVQVQ